MKNSSIFQVANKELSYFDRHLTIDKKSTVMKRSFILFFMIALSTAIVSCSGNEAVNQNESAAVEEAPAKPAQEKKALEENAIDEIVLTKLKKAIEKRGITLSDNQLTELTALIKSSGITKNNLKEKKPELLDKIKSEILTEEQQAKVK